MQTEIEVSRGFVIGIASVFVVALLLVVGVIASPRDASGRPLLLSPERRAILHFLRQADGWEKEATSLLSDLDQLASEIQMSPAPENLYERARGAQNALGRARALEKSVVQARVPDAMTDLHRLALEAAIRTREYAESVSARVGVPEGEITGRNEAHNAVEKFGESLRATRGIP